MLWLNKMYVTVNRRDAKRRDGNIKLARHPVLECYKSLNSLGQEQAIASLCKELDLDDLILRVPSKNKSGFNSELIRSGLSSNPNVKLSRQIDMLRAGLNKRLLCVVLKTRILSCCTGRLTRCIAWFTQNTKQITLGASEPTNATTTTRMINQTVDDMHVSSLLLGVQERTF